MSETLTLDALKVTMAAIRAARPIAPNEGRIIESVHMVKGPFEDWSRVRSPGRARRRRRQGHRQNIRFFYVPRTDFLRLEDGTLVGHPSTVAVLRARIATSIQFKADRLIADALFGRPPGV